jgi:uridylate kinase
MDRVILKLSGQALSDNGQGVSTEKLQHIASEIKELVSKPVSLGIICGAGNIFRGRDSLAYHMDRQIADSMGMLGTVINSLAVKDALEHQSIKAVILTSTPIPAVAKMYSQDTCEEYLQQGYVVIFAGGIGNPYFSTDTTAVLRALEMKASTILMAKNGCDGVYDCDPNKNPNAKKFSSLSYQEMVEKNLSVIDLTASILSEQNDVTTIVFDMNQKGSILKAYVDPSIGTVIKNKK